MANQNSAKGNPASTRMSNPKYKAKRAANKIKNENAKARGLVTTKEAKNLALHNLKVENKGLGQREVRRILTGKRTQDADLKLVLKLAK
jgi:hypothetical protein